MPVFSSRRSLRHWETLGFGLHFFLCFPFVCHSFGLGCQLSEGSVVGRQLLLDFVQFKENTLPMPDFCSKSDTVWELCRVACTLLLFAFARCFAQSWPYYYYYYCCYYRIPLFFYRLKGQIRESIDRLKYFFLKSRVNAGLLPSGSRIDLNAA